MTCKLISIKTLIITLYVVFCSNLAISRTSFATVSKVRGEVTKLLPGHMQAKEVKRGDQLIEETSVVTGENSFVRLLFPNKSQVNLGPETKFVVTQLEKEKPDVITLLKGTVRSKMQNSDNQFYLKTKTAAIGVRGTDFQSVYNPQNEVTSTLTYQGEVAMAYIDEGQLLASLESQTTETVEKVRRYQESELEIEEVEVKKSPLNLSESLDSNLKKEDAVVVKNGQFSGVLKGHKLTSLPVQISPAQLKSLYLNEDLEDVVNKSELMSGEVLLQASGENWPSQAPQSVPKEGIYRPETGEYAPKAGGYVDFQSGLYISPSKDADYSAETDVYVAEEEVGEFDKRTGQYMAPQGLKLDAKKGFVFADNKTEKSQRSKEKGGKEKLLAMRESLNRAIAKEVLLSSSEELKKREKTFGILSLRERITKNVITFSLRPLSHSIEYTEDSQHGDTTIDNSGDYLAELDWYHPSLNRFQLITGLSIKRVSSNPGDQDLGYSTDSLMNIRAGGRYFVTSRWSVKTLLSLDQNHFVVYEDQSSGGELSEIRRIMVPKLVFGVSGELFHAFAGRFSLDLDSQTYTNLEKETGTFLIPPGMGLKTTLSGKYWWGANTWSSLGFWFEHQNYDVEGEDYKAVQSMDTNGLFMQLGYLF